MLRALSEQGSALKGPRTRDPLLAGARGGRGKKGRASVRASDRERPANSVDVFGLRSTHLNFLKILLSATGSSYVPSLDFLAAVLAAVAVAARHSRRRSARRGALDCGIVRVVERGEENGGQARAVSRERGRICLCWVAGKQQSVGLEPRGPGGGGRTTRSVGAAVVAVTAADNDEDASPLSSFRLRLTNTHQSIIIITRATTTRRSQAS